MLHFKERLAENDNILIFPVTFYFLNRLYTLSQEPVIVNNALEEK